MSQGWSKIFNRINWLNRPSTNTPLNATNLNAGDSAIDKLDDRIITLDTVKADMQVVNGMVADVLLNESNGVITITYKNGSTKTYDTNLEKIATNFTYDYSTQKLVLTLSDGSKQYVDMSALITQYEFKDSTTIAFSVDSTGKVSASVKNGSITDAMLETGYLANIKVEVAKADAAASQAQSSETSSDYNAKLSRSYAIGGSGIREGEDTDNAMYYYEQAKKTDIGQISSDVAELNSNLSVIGKCKNLLNLTLQTTTVNGITCTDNGDGTFTLNGTATATTEFNIIKYSVGLRLTVGNKYKLIGCPNINGIKIHLQDTSYKQTVININGTEPIFNALFKKYYSWIIIESGTTLSNVVIKPMITENLNATYDDFVAYTGDGETLTADVAEIKNDLGGLSLSVSGTTLSITDGKNTWTLEAN